MFSYNILINGIYPHALRLCLAVVLIKQNWKMTVFLVLLGVVDFSRDTCQVSESELLKLG